MALDTEDFAGRLAILQRYIELDAKADALELCKALQVRMVTANVVPIAGTVLMPWPEEPATPESDASEQA